MFDLMLLDNGSVSRFVSYTLEDIRRGGMVWSSCATPLCHGPIQANPGTATSAVANAFNDDTLFFILESLPES
jgi:hypothetical protein